MSSPSHNHRASLSGCLLLVVLWGIGIGLAIAIGRGVDWFHTHCGHTNQMDYCSWDVPR